MAKSSVAIVTDSNSGITQAKAEALGISVIPMPFFINGKEYFEDVDLTQEQFYQFLADENTDFSTSMPAPGTVLDTWEELLKTYDEVIYIPMSSGLSASCQTAISLADEFDGKVQIVDNKRISVTMLQSVLDAIALREQGKNALEIREILENSSYHSSIYIMVDTLKYLKKGGRVTPAAALSGTVLGLKPVLQIQGDKLDAYAKARGVKMAKKQMIKAIRHDIETRFKEYGDKLRINVVTCYGMEEQSKEWLREVEEAFPDYEVVPEVELLALSIICHTGPGCLAVTVSEALDK
jgi:DegV family protein with EDD domain